ncbi:hypothetical protein JYU20_04600, partial [Bacteroidales bacterium AH-315-I05]|nr:hypothetical protein [Bacteroidales bacterium AH-315-I05]
MMLTSTICVIFLLVTLTGASQGVGVNETGAVPDASAILDAASTTKGILTPRMTIAQRNTIASPATGLLIYQTDNNPGYYYNAGTPGVPNWVHLFYGSSDGGWDLTGNTGTTVGTNFLGTTDAQDLAIYTNNAEKLRVTSAGNVGIGTTTPSSILEVSQTDASTAIHIVNTSSTAVRNPRLNIYNYQGAIVGGSSTIQMHQAAGTSTSPTATPTGAGIGALDFDGYNGSVFKDGAKIQAKSSEAWTGSAWGTYLSFHTTANGTTHAGTPIEVVRFAHDGKVGIGTTAPTGKLTVVENNESTTLTDFTQAVTKAGILISTEYTVGAYTPGIFWQTSNQSSTKPKAGIWLFENAAGSDMYFGTSDTYATGITNTGLVLDQSGKVGIGTTTPAGRLSVVSGNLAGGLINLADNETNATDKYATVTLKHFTNAEEPVLLIGGQSFTGTSTVLIGGNFSTANTAEEIKFYTAANTTTTTGTQRMMIDGNGNVGVGATAPKTALAVNTSAIPQSGSTTAIFSAAVEIYSTGDSWIDLYGTDNGGNKWTILNNNNTGDAGELAFQNALSTKVTFLTNGNVGIGTATPDASLDVNGNASFGTDNISIGSTTGAAGERANINYNGTGARFTIKGLTGVNTSIGANGTDDYLYIKNDGNVGIGTTAPFSKLQVQGDVFLEHATTTTSNSTAMFVWGNDLHTAGTKGSVLGLYSLGLNGESATTTEAVGVYGVSGLESSANGTVTNAYGLKARVQDGLGTVTNGYGVYIEDVQAATDYGIYQVGTDDDNYFAGNVSIGTTTPLAKLTVDGNASFIHTTATTGNSIAMILWGNDQHTAGTKSYVYGLYSLGLNGASATTTDAIGVYAIGGLENSATGTVTNAYGLKAKAQDGLGTVTNGYGVYIEDVQATTGYGLYQAGANDDNYFAGKVGIGTATPGGLFDVAGSLGNFTVSSDGARIDMSRPATNYIRASSVGGALDFIVNGNAASDATASLILRPNGNVEIPNGNVGIG